MTDETEQRAALFLLRREELSWSQEDEAGFNAWLDQSDGHKAAFWRLEHCWLAADRIAALGTKPYRSNAPLHAARTFSVRAAMALAASIVPLLICAALLFQPAPVLRYEKFASDEQRKTVRFPDGTTVELNTNSRIRVAMTKGRRSVLLDKGEAYFDVTHDATRPFHVQIGDYRVTDLGTKFSIRKDGGRIVTAVLEGKVQLGRAGEGNVGEAVLLKAGDWASSQGGTTSTHTDDLDDIEAMLGWRSGLIIFNHQTLGEAAREFGRYNDTKLVIADAEIAAMRIDGAFKTRNVDGFARLMRDAYGLRVEKSGEKIKISKK